MKYSGCMLVLSIMLMFQLASSWMFGQKNQKKTKFFKGMEMGDDKDDTLSIFKDMGKVFNKDKLPTNIKFDKIPKKKGYFLKASARGMSFSSSSSTSSTDPDLPGPCPNAKNPQCFVCNRARSVEQCDKKGQNVRCARGQDACILEKVKIDNKDRYYRRCGNLCECDTNTSGTIESCKKAKCEPTIMVTEDDQEVVVTDEK